MAQPCSYIYPIYSVVKHHRQALLTSTPWGAGHHSFESVQGSSRKLLLAASTSYRHYLSRSGGADRDRTDDILLAKQALSQLSYSPHKQLHKVIPIALPGQDVVGLGRLELPTSPLSGVRSNHLSYRPILWKLVELVGIEPATS